MITYKTLRELKERLEFDREVAQQDKIRARDLAIMAAQDGHEAQAIQLLVDGRHFGRKERYLQSIISRIEICEIVIGGPQHAPTK